MRNIAQVRRDRKTEKNAPGQTIDRYSGEFNLSQKCTECKKTHLMEVTYLLTYLLSYLVRRSAVRCGHGTFCQMLAVVYINSFLS